MFTGTVGRIRMDVDIRTAGAMAQIAGLKKMIEGVGDRGDLGDLFAVPKKSFAQLGREADQTGQQLNSLVMKGYYLQAAISSLVPVIAQLAGGLFALGSQAAAAGPALVVLPGILSAIMQAGITAKLALGGVGKAVGELGKAKTPSVDQMPAKLEAFRNAQERVRRAQEALNRAYREAAERIQQLGFDTEDAAIGQEKAALALQDARETLARVQDLPPNSRARKEAELAFKEADLNYRRAIDTSNDLAEEQKRVTKDGTLNAEQQVEQSDEVLNAIREQKKAVEGLAKAQADLQKGNSGAGALAEFNKLSAAAQKFAQYLVSLKPEIKKLKDAAGEELFGPLEASIQNIVENLFPKLEPILRETGRALGQTALDFSKTVTEAKNLAAFESIGKTNVYVTERFGKVLGNLYTVLVQVLDAAGPLIKRFTDWVVVLTGGWGESSKAANETGKLARVFEYAGDVASQLGDIIGDLGGALMNMGRAASGPGSGGEMIFDAMEKSAKKFREFTKRISEDGSLEDYFKQSATGFLQVFGILGKIIKIVLKSATQPGTKEFLDSISRAVDHLGVGFEHLAGSAPAFGKFIENFARMIVAFTESGSIVAFFETLTKAVKIVANIMENELIAKIFGFLAVMHGAKLAIMVVKAVLVKLGLYLIYLVRMALKPVAFLFKLLTSTLGLSTAAAVGLMAAFVAIIAVLVMSYKKSENFRKSLSDLVKTTFEALKKAANDIKKAFDDAFGSILKKGTTAGSIFKGIGDALAKYVVPIYKYIIPRVIDIFKQLVIALIKIVAGIVQIFYGLFQTIGGLIKIFKGDFSDGFSGIKDGAVSMFKGLLKIIVGFFKAIPALIKMVMGNMLGPVGFAIYEAIAGAFKAVGRAIATVWNKVIKPVFGLIAQAFAAIGGPAVAGIGKVFGLIGSALGKISGAGLKGLSVSFTAIAGAAGTLGKVLKPVLGVVLKIVKAIGIVLYVAALVTFTAIGLLIAGIWRTLKRVGVAIWQNLIYPFSKVALPVITNVFGVIATVVGKTFDILKIAVKVFIGVFYFSFKGISWLIKKIFSVEMLNIIKKVFNVIVNIVTGAFDIFKTVFKVFAAVFKTVFDVLVAVFKTVFSVVQKVFSVVWNVILKAVPILLKVATTVFNGLLTVFSAIWNGIKTVFENVWPLIWGGIQWAWNNVIKPVFKLIGTVFAFMWRGVKAIFENVWPLIWGGIQWAWNNVIKPVFGLIGTVFAFMWRGVKAVFDAVWPLIWGAISWAWNNVIKPVFGLIGTVFSTIWNGIKAVFNLVWPPIWGAISWAWNNVIKPVFGFIGELFGTIWNGIKAVFEPIWNGITGAISWAWNNVIKPVADQIGEIFGRIWSGISTAFTRMWDGIKLMFTNFPQFLKNVWNNALDFVDGFLDAIINGFKQIPSLIGKVFSGIINIFKEGVNLIIKGFNNTLGGKSFTLPGFLGGGTFGFGKIDLIGGKDTTSFEDVVTGGYRKIPKLAMGGTVLPSRGGTLVNVAEAGRAERIEPLDRDGLSKRDKAMIAMLAGGGTGGVTINVHPSPGMNEVELAALVNRQLAFELRKGAA
jgi:phage-related protein